MRRKITGKHGPLTLWRPAPLIPEDFTEIMREIVPQIIDQNLQAVSAEDAPMEDEHASAPSSGSGQKRPASPSSAADQPMASRPRVDTADEALSVQCVNELWDQWTEQRDIEQLVVNYMQKKTSHELPHSNNEPCLQEMIDDSKVTELNTIISKGAIRIHYGKKAQEIKKKHANRFIGSRFVITRKPLQENGHYDPLDPKTYRVKSRLCLQGHLDPDLSEKAASGRLQSPTLSQLGRNTLMQLLASHRWTLELGDIQGAFMEAVHCMPPFHQGDFPTLLLEPS